MLWILPPDPRNNWNASARVIFLGGLLGGWRYSSSLIPDFKQPKFWKMGPYKSRFWGLSSCQWFDQNTSHLSHFFLLYKSRLAKKILRFKAWPPNTTYHRTHHRRWWAAKQMATPRPRAPRCQWFKSVVRTTGSRNWHWTTPLFVPKRLNHWGFFNHRTRFFKNYTNIDHQVAWKGISHFRSFLNRFKTYKFQFL